MSSGPYILGSNSARAWPSPCSPEREPPEPERIHWSFPDPALEIGSEGTRYHAFEQTSLQLAPRIRFLPDHVERARQCVHSEPLWTVIQEGKTPEKLGWKKSLLTKRRFKAIQFTLRETHSQYPGSVGRVSLFMSVLAHVTWAQKTCLPTE